MLGPDLEVGLLDLVMSVESVAAQLELAAVDRAVEQRLPGVRQEQRVAELTDAFVTGGPVAGPVVEIAVLEGLRGKAEDNGRDFREWWIRVITGAQDKLQALADKVISTARQLGVSAGHLIGRPQRRAPTEVTVTMVVRSAPSLASLDASGVVKLLSGLLSLELDVAVKYGAKP